MKILNETVTNFKSLYGTHTFNFEELNGLVKLSGPVGVGKTSLGESLLFGLYGAVKGQNIPNLISWNAKYTCVELNMLCGEHTVHIVRNSAEPLIVEVDGHTLAATNKRDTQQILEEEIYDVPKLAVQKMCIISFNAFNSLASMSAGETKQFLDEIFGFRIFTQYNDEIVNERRIQQNENMKLAAIYTDTKSQIEYLESKKETQKNELTESIDIKAMTDERAEYVSQGKDLKIRQQELQNELQSKQMDYTKQMTEYATMGRQYKEYYNKFKSGVCPTCGHAIDSADLEQHRNKMLEYAAKYKEAENNKNTLAGVYNPQIADLTSQMLALKEKINVIDAEILQYNNNLQMLNENYDDIISEYENKLKEIQSQLDVSDIEIGQWNEMNELFTKTLRYNLLETLIPHINKSIKYYINKLEQPYTIEYDQEFKPHIFTDAFEKEISYSSLSTGQKKSLDMAIIFGVLQNIIANVEFNIFFLDELFSNLDSDARNIMLSLLKESLGKNRTIFVINHAEMNDDYFDHKIRVSLENTKIYVKKIDDDVIVKSSKYINVF